MRLRSKLVIAFVLVAIVPATTVGAIGYGLAEEALRDQVRDQMDALASVQEARVTDAIDQNLESLRLVASRPGLRENLQNHTATGSPAALEGVDRSIAAAQAAAPRFEVVSVANASGAVIASTDAGELDRNRSGEVLLQRALDGPVLHLGRSEGGGLELHLAAPLVIDGEFQGWLLIRTRAQAILDVVTDRTGLGRTGETLISLRNDQGQLLILTPTRFSAGRGTTFFDIASNDSVSARAAAGEERVIEDGQDYRGAEVLAATRYIDDPGWGLVVKMDRDEAFAPVTALARAAAIAGGLSIVLAAVVAGLLADRLARPIIHLTDVADDIAGGDLSRRANVHTRDEVSTLATDFNRMADALTSANAALETRVRERTRELERSHRELAEFAQIASHDLHAPLRHVSGFADLLARHRNEDADETERRYIAAIEQAVGEARDLTGSLLAFTRVAAREYQPQPVDLNKVVRLAEAALASRIRNEGATLDVADLPVVKGDAAQLRVVFHHLIDNALKFRREEPPVIRVRARPHGDAWRVEVADNGVGIDPRYHERVWALFGRLQPKTERPGSGVGLTLVRRIIDRHGGHVGLESEVGEGTTVWFILPAASDPDPATASDT